MSNGAMFSSDSQVTPGQELFRSARSFSLWAHTASHSQTLFRSPNGPDRRGLDQQTRIDLYFKPISAIKLRMYYDGLIVRCATDEQEQQIRAECPGVDHRSTDRFMVLESGLGLDYVIASAFAWHEDDGLGPSHFAGWHYSPETPTWGQGPLFGVDADLDERFAVLDELVRAIQETGTAPPEDRTRYGYVYITMARFEPPATEGEPYVVPIGAFLTRAEAEQRIARPTPGFDKTWIEVVPLPV